MQVIWSPDAEKELDNIIEYCLTTFGMRTASNVYKVMKHYDTLLAQNPYMGKTEVLLEKYPQKFRSMVVHQHYKLVYYVDNHKEEIRVTDIWDTRRNPDSLANRIK